MRANEIHVEAIIKTIDKAIVRTAKQFIEIDLDARESQDLLIHSQQEMTWLLEAREELETAIFNPEARQRVVRDFVGSDPYCWVVLPNFSELEEGRFETIIVEFPQSDECIEAPLLY